MNADNEQNYKARYAQRTTFRRILDTALDGYWLVGKQGNLLDVNNAACAMLDYSREEMLHLRVSDIDIIDTPATIKARIEKMQGTGGDRFESRHRRSDKSEVDVEVSISLLNEE